MLKPPVQADTNGDGFISVNELINRLLGPYDVRFRRKVDRSRRVAPFWEELIQTTLGKP